MGKNALHKLQILKENLFAINIMKMLVPTSINVNRYILGMSNENYCTYCCVGEFGNEYENDKLKCLKSCIEVLL
jgi:hypothetical protein